MEHAVGDTSVASREIEQPLAAGRLPAPSAVMGVVMAAGSSRRFSGNKLLEPFRGKPLLRWVVEAALRSRLESVNVVLGHQHDRVRHALADLDGTRRLTFTLNDRHEYGQSESIIAGLSAVAADIAGAMFLVGDQPLLDAAVIDRLIAAFEASPTSICYPWCEGQRRNPVIFPRRFFADLRQLRGDVGGSVVIAEHLDAAIAVPFGEPKSFRDVDRRADIDVLSQDGGDATGPAAMTLVGALGLETSRVISFCGSGGKTGLMAALVHEFSAQVGERILATTTTKMGIEEADGPWHACRTAGAAELFSASERLTQAMLAYRAVDAQRGRLLGFPPDTIDALVGHDRFTRILVEADGSRRRPLKGPGANEPVFPASTDVVVIVAGLSGLGRPLSEDVVFRADSWAKLTGCRLSERIAADALARVITDRNGVARGAPPRARRVLFLNQADTPERRADADGVIRALSTRGGRPPERSVVGVLLPAPRVWALREHAAGEG